MGTEKKYTPKDCMAAYLKMKDDLDTQRKKWKTFESVRKEQMDKVLAMLSTMMTELDTDQLKKDGVGIAFYKTTEILNITDWDAALEYIKANELFHVLTKKLSKVAVQEIVKETGEVFPGAELGAIRKLHVNSK